MQGSGSGLSLTAGGCRLRRKITPSIVGLVRSSSKQVPRSGLVHSFIYPVYYFPATLTNVSYSKVPSWIHLLGIVA